MVLRNEKEYRDKRKGMEQNFLIYNTLTRRKELFKPLHAPHVGMYVCGPTVYGDPHLGHARPAITFDVLFRYLKHQGYQVRYVRNITDVGHLEHDADEGDDKIEKKARLEQLEPMEIAQFYTNRYHDAMDALNVLRPSIEPHATGHVIEQEELVQQILDNGYAYESHGSVYFDVVKYDKDHRYGVLSGRNLHDIINHSRELQGVGEKRNQADFAQPLEHGVPRMALRMHGHGAQIFGRPFRHSWRRHGPYLPPSRVRDSTSCGESGRTDGEILDAQQHDYHQWAENG